MRRERKAVMEIGADRVDQVVVLENWIRDQLMRAGISEFDATVAIDEALDWRTMMRLRQSGCPSEFALAIVR
jgi:hypothetical protein